MIVVADGSSLCTASLSVCRSSCLNPCSWTQAKPDRHPPASCSPPVRLVLNLPRFDPILVMTRHELGVDRDSLQVESSVRVKLQFLRQHALVSASYHRDDSYAS